MRKLLKHPTSLALGIVLGVILLLAAIKYFQISRAIAANQSAAPPPIAVTSAIATETDWKNTFAAVGSLRPIQGTTLSAESAGDVTKIHFDSGATVKTGDIIIELDTAVEEAELKAAIARKEAAQQNLTRAEKLIVNSATSQASLETAQADYRAAAAEVLSLQAHIERKRIIAPFAGTLGIRLVNLGQYVAPGMPVIPLHDSRSLYLNFRVPQNIVPSVTLGSEVELHVTGLSPTFSGKVSAIDPQIDENTRTLGVQATVANSDNALRSGMFVHLNLLLNETKRLITVPSSAVQYAPYGDTIFVIEEMKTPEGAAYRGVREQIVKLGPSRGEQVAVLSGVQAGAEIVSSGTFKLRPGAAVMVNNSLSPGNSPNPTPADS